MTKDERIRLIEIASKLEAVQNEFETVELIIAAQTLAVNRLISEILSFSGTKITE